MAPVAYDRTQLPYVEAMQAVDLARLTRRSEAEAALAAAVAEPAIRTFLAQSLVIDEGGAAWKLNLPVLGAEMPKIMGFPEITGRFEGPALFVTGARSDYVRPEDRQRIAARFPDARYVAIPGAGHWLHADAPAAFIAAVEEFLTD